MLTTSCRVPLVGLLAGWPFARDARKPSCEDEDETPVDFGDGQKMDRLAVTVTAFVFGAIKEVTIIHWGRNLEKLPGQVFCYGHIQCSILVAVIWV